MVVCIWYEILGVGYVDCDLEVFERFFGRIVWSVGVGVGVDGFF